MEVLADNIVYLKKNDPVLYDALKKREEQPTEPSVILEDTKNNKKTLKIKRNDKILYLHSKYDPIKEAELIIDKLEEREEITKDTHVIFYGLGLGYHLDAFLKRYPKNEFSVYEPSIDVLNQYFNHISLNHLPVKQLVAFQAGYDSNSMNEFFNIILKRVKKQCIICDLPPYQKVFKEEYVGFFNQFKEAIKNLSSSINTNYAFKKRWILNSVVNFKEVIITPNILMENNGIFKDETAILVSAGPSLDYEIENLKLIKEKGLAYIFAVGSSINTLIYHDLFPDAMCTYDPTELNKIVFNKLNESDISSIPMIFGSSVGFETLQEYHGPKYHMLTSQDTVSQYFLKTQNEDDLLMVSDAPSIAVVTLELLNKLGFGEVVLVGQNLAYLDKKNYAGGIDYQQNNDDIDSSDMKTVEDVTGNTIFTTDSYLNMKRMMEYHIKSRKIKVINTTRGGANIDGTEYIPLEEVIKERISISVLNGDEFKTIIPTELYKHTYIKMQFEKMNKAYGTYRGLLSMMKQSLIKINELIVNKNIKQSILMYSQLDSLIISLENNDFARVVALPMNRVEHELLAINVQWIKKEKNELKKIGELIFYVNTFIDLLYRDSHLNQQIMEILSKNINNNQESCGL